MRFDEWESVYGAVLADFGYDRTADERARDRLGSLLSGADPLALESLCFDEQVVAVAGAAASLAGDVDVASDADAVIAASTAASELVDTGVQVDCVVTDLDGDPERAGAFSRAGIPVAVHAHGDNVPAVEAHLPSFDGDAVLPTTQARPAGPVVNPGGFTDGDRAAFLGDHCGAEQLVFPGWDFEDATVTAEKSRKLRWAERLLYWLERRRGERFAVLDGRRDGIDAGALPVD